MRTVDTLHEPLACVDAAFGTELQKCMRVHPIPLTGDFCARSVRVGIGSLFAFTREVRLESTCNGEPFGVEGECGWGSG